MYKHMEQMPRGFVLADKQTVAETRLPLFFLQDRHSLGRRTELPLWKFLVSSIWKMNPNQYAVTEIRGDWRFFVDTFNMKATPSSTCICFKCRATMHNYASFGPAAAWTETMRSTRDFVENVIPELDHPDTCALVWLPRFHIDMIRPCWLHTAHLGVGLFTNGSAMKLMLDRGLFGQGETKDVQMRNMFVRFQTWRKEKCISVAMPRFKGFLLKEQPLQQVFYHSKAWHGRVLTSFLADIMTKETRDRPDDLELARAAVCIWHLGELYNVVEKAPRYLSAEAPSTSKRNLYIYIYICVSSWFLLNRMKLYNPKSQYCTKKLY